MSCYQCPLCHSPLSLVGAGWQCAQQHRFDCAKEGYVNLLPVQFKRSKTPGDSAQMIQSRREFLDAGYYQPLRQQVMTLIGSLAHSPQANWLDLGCGEGYYSAALADRLASLSPGARVYGLDISRVAIRSAARRYPAVQCCVASSQRLPFNDGALDGMMRIYAPCNPAEMERTIKPGGVVLTVTPGPRHLLQLKALIYQQVLLHPLKDEPFAGFTPLFSHQLAYPLSMSGPHAGALLQMTPFAWRASTEVMEQLVQRPQFEVETDFIIRAWRRNDE